MQMTLIGDRSIGIAASAIVIAPACRAISVARSHADARRPLAGLTVKPMDVSASMIWTVVSLAALLILAAVALTILRRRSEPISSWRPRVEPTTLPSWALPASEEDEPPPLPTRYGTWTPTIACSDRGEFAAQLLEAAGNYSIRGRDTDVDCELTFFLRLSNAIGDAFVDGLPVVAANDIEVADASLEELDGSYRDNIPLRPVIFKNDTRLYLGVGGREFRSGPTYRLRFRASYETAAG
jgi:hypothetical protein